MFLSSVRALEKPATNLVKAVRAFEAEKIFVMVLSDSLLNFLIKTNFGEKISWHRLVLPTQLPPSFTYLKRLLNAAIAPIVPVP